MIAAATDAVNRSDRIRENNGGSQERISAA
jgi:hypothetical protein